MKNLLFLLAQIAVVIYAKDQSVAVEGEVLCHQRPYAGAQMFLMEDDLFDPDDILDRMRSNITGGYSMTGWDNEFGSIQPYLKITHTCMYNPQDKPCVRTIRVLIPDEAIQQDRIIMKKYVLNPVELAEKRKGEKGGCY